MCAPHHQWLKVGIWLPMRPPWMLSWLEWVDVRLFPTWPPLTPWGLWLPLDLWVAGKVLLLTRCPLTVLRGEGAFLLLGGGGSHVLWWSLLTLQAGPRAPYCLEVMKGPAPYLTFFDIILVGRLWHFITTWWGWQSRLQHGLSWCEWGWCLAEVENLLSQSALSDLSAHLAREKTPSSVGWVLLLFLCACFVLCPLVRPGCWLLQAPSLKIWDVKKTQET